MHDLDYVRESWKGFNFYSVGCVGTIKWKIQELPAQSSGKQTQGEKVIGILSVPKRRQSGETPRRYCGEGRDKDVP